MRRLVSTSLGWMNFGTSSNFGPSSGYILSVSDATVHVTDVLEVPFVWRMRASLEKCHDPCTLFCLERHCRVGVYFPIDMSCTDSSRHSRQSNINSDDLTKDPIVSEPVTCCEISIIPDASVWHRLSAWASNFHSSLFEKSGIFWKFTCYISSRHPVDITPWRDYRYKIIKFSSAKWDLIYASIRITSDWGLSSAAKAMVVCILEILSWLLYEDPIATRTMMTVDIIPY